MQTTSTLHQPLPASIAAGRRHVPSRLWTGGGLAPSTLASIASDFARHEARWRPMLRLDPDERWSERLHIESEFEVWLIGWEVGQDTELHDHGGSAGAFKVVMGRLTEDVYRPQRGTLARRDHPRGTTTRFGPSYVHNVMNLGPEPAASVHAYSPPLSRMGFYELDPAGLLQTACIAVDGPEPPAPR